MTNGDGLMFIGDAIRSNQGSCLSERKGGSLRTGAGQTTAVHEARLIMG